MRTTIQSRAKNRYVGSPSDHDRYWGTHSLDGTHDPAETARIMDDNVAHFSMRSRKQTAPHYAAGDRLVALQCDARRQMAYRDLILASSLGASE